MNKILMLIAPVMLLVGCDTVQNTNWSVDCEKYSSYDRREYDQCLKRNPNRAESVSLDPNDVSRPSEQDLGKGPN